MAIADFRSDTLTQPTEAMRNAMAHARVGDDVYGEDPTIRELEEKAAHCMGQQAALFVPTGCMGNQIAVHIRTQPGDEVAMERFGHTVQYELGAVSALSGVMPHILDGDRGILAPEQIRAAIRPEIYYLSPISLLILENTHNVAGGSVWPLDRFEAVVAEARQAGWKIHLDGARIFNAAVAVGCSPAEWAGKVDSVMFCLSKALGAPVGSMLCGDDAFIQQARRVRKMFGGGMRQVGVLGAAGLIALKEGPGQLAADHARAKALREGLASLPGVVCPPAETNMVVAELQETGIDSDSFLARLKDREVLAGAVTSHRVRFVTYRDVGDEDVERALDAAKAALS